MKKGILFAAVLLGCTRVFAGEEPKKETPDVAAMVVQAKAQELARALVQLKLEEVALSRAQPVDQEKLALVRAQQAALNAEMADLVSLPLKRRLEKLEATKKEFLKTMNARNPKMLELQAEIDKVKAELDRPATSTPQESPVSK